MYKLISKKILLLLIIVVFGGLLRFSLLSKYPVQLNHDEVSQIYDTVSIVKTGKDIYGTFFPLAFPSTGEYKIGHYIYISVLPYLLFGSSEFTIRIPSAFFGTLMILAVFLFVSRLTNNWKLALISASLVAISPSEIFYSRKSFENIISTFFVFIGLFSFLNSLEQNRSKVWLYCSVIFFALAMYIYTAQTITVPLIVVSLFIIFRARFYTRPKDLYTCFIFLIILLLPLFYLSLTNSSIRFRASSVSVLQDVNLGAVLNQAKSDNYLLSSLYRYKRIADYVLTRYLNQFRPDYLFLYGLDFTNQGPVGMGPLLLVQLPFLLIGVIYLAWKKLFSDQKKLLIVLTLIAVIPSSITFEPFSPHRLILAFSSLNILSSFGLYWFIKQVNRSMRNFTFIRYGVFGILIVLFILNFIYFVHMYTVNFPYEKSQHMHYPFKEIALYAWSKYQDYDQIIWDPRYGQSAPVMAVATHYYLAYYGDYPPEKFQTNYHIDNNGTYFDKFSIRKVEWERDKHLKKTLLIASQWSLPLNIDQSKITKTFYFYDKQPAYYAISLSD